MVNMCNEDAPRPRKLRRGVPRRKLRVRTENRPTPEQAQEMIRQAAPQIARLLGWAQEQSQKEAA